MPTAQIDVDVDKAATELATGLDTAYWKAKQVSSRQSTADKVKSTAKAVKTLKENKAAQLLYTIVGPGATPNKAAIGMGIAIGVVLTVALLGKKTRKA